MYKEIFKVPLLDSVYSKSLNMTSFGFFSKNRLDDKRVVEILGENSNLNLLIEDSQLQDRIDRYRKEQI